MRAARSNPLILVVMSFLVIGLTYSTFSISDAYAVPRHLDNPVCSGPDEEGWDMCCSTYDDDAGSEGEGEYSDCSVCREESPGNFDCDVPDDWWEAKGLVPGTTPSDIMTGDKSPIPPGPRSGPGNLLPEGVFEGPQTPPSLEGPTDLTPQVDCALNPNDPLCETATIPEGENESQTQGRIIGESPSPTGYCAPIRTPTCIPCDPGLPGSTCVPESDWPPTRTTDTGTPEEAVPLVPPTTGPLGETAPQIAPPTAEDGTGQPPTEALCIEGFELDEDTNLCVLTESQITDEPQEAAEPEEQQQTEEQPSEESDSEEENGNN